MLGESISKFFKFDSLVGNVTGYFETKIELLKLEIKQDVSRGLAKAINYLLLAFVFGLVILFISLGIAVALANRLGPLAGYGIVGGFYLLVGVFLALNNQRVNTIIEGMISKAFNKKK